MSRDSQCKPCSVLHNGTRLLRDPQSLQLGAVLQTIREKEPMLAVLEHVKGINRVIGAINRRLRSLKRYVFARVDIDPAEMGEPISRPRVSFILLRRDVLACPVGDLQNNIGALSGVGLVSSSLVSPTDRLWASDSAS